MQYVLSRAFEQNAIISVSQDGIVERHPSKLVWAPKLWLYARQYNFPFKVIEGRNQGKSWVICLVPDEYTIPQEALNDPDCLLVTQDNYFEQTKQTDWNLPDPLDQEEVSSYLTRIGRTVLGHSKELEL